jgi:putative ATP-binding cassette transporter
LALFYLERLPMLKAEGKTIVALTHDDRNCHLADRIIKLEPGRIALAAPL